MGAGVGETEEEKMAPSFHKRHQIGPFRFSTPTAVNRKVASSNLARGANFSRFFKRLQRPAFLESLEHLEQLWKFEIDSNWLRNIGFLNLLLGMNSLMTASAQRNEI